MLDTSLVEHKMQVWIERDGERLVLDVSLTLWPNGSDVTVLERRPAPERPNANALVPLSDAWRELLQAKFNTKGATTILGVSAPDSRRRIMAREIMRVPAEGPLRYDWVQLDFYADAEMTRLDDSGISRIAQSNALNLGIRPFDPDTAYWVDLSPAIGRGRLIAPRSDTLEQRELQQAVLKAAARRAEGHVAPTVQQLNCRELETPVVFPSEQRHRLVVELQFRDDGQPVHTPRKKAGSRPHRSKDCIQLASAELMADTGATHRLSFEHEGWTVDVSVSFKSTESIAFVPGETVRQWVGRLAVKDSGGYQWQDTVTFAGSMNVEPGGAARLGHLLTTADEVLVDEFDHQWSVVPEWEHDGRSVRVMFGDRLELDHGFVDGQSCRSQSWTNG